MKPNKHRISASLFFLIYSAIAASSLVHAAQERPFLESAKAHQIVSACREKALENGWKMAVAVYDDKATLISFLRMDDVKIGNVKIAMVKGEASASYGRPTKYWADKAASNPVFLEMPLFPAFGGGEPIYAKDGTLLGGVGVSGSSDDNDAQCARAGINDVNLDFKRPE